MTKQNVLHEQGGTAIKEAIQQAIRDGWTVQSVTVNSDTNHWIVIVAKDGK